MTSQVRSCWARFCQFIRELDGGRQDAEPLVELITGFDVSTCFSGLIVGMQMIQADPEQRLETLGSFAQNQFAGGDMTGVGCWTMFCIDIRE
jgi:hypothetical protein